MCGRTACTLAPDDLCKACGHKSKNGKWRQPRWQNAPGGQQYYTSYNVAPTAHTPVLLSKKHFMTTKQEEKQQGNCENDTEMDSNDSESECEWVIQPMHWGLVPFWHAGDPKSVGFSMINARSDGILSKRSFKVPLEKGQRCVVLADGYFEWHKTPEGCKQPYFVYLPYVATDALAKVNQQMEVIHKDTVYTGRRLLTLAGVFDIWRANEGCEPLYSYSLITTDSHTTLSWMHDRMPAVLESEKDVRAWLDYGSVSLADAVKLIKPTSNLHWHPVSSVVNSVKNKSEDCVLPINIELEKKKSEGGSSSLMKTWLGKGKKRPPNSDNELKDEKNAEREFDEQLTSPKKKQKTI